MSIPVAIEDLADAVSEYGWAYVVTVRDDATPHIVAVTPEWADGVAVFDAGRGTQRNATERPAVTLCYPPVEADGHSLIIDGAATVTDAKRLCVTPTGAVLHRPAG